MIINLPSELFKIMCNYLNKDFLKKPFNNNILNFQLTCKYIFESIENELNLRGRLVIYRTIKLYNTYLFDSNRNVNITWNIPFQSVNIIRKFRKTLILKIGDIISYIECNSCIKIINFVGIDNEPNLIEIEYLLWENNKWITSIPLFQIQDNIRRIICYPIRYPQCGEHIDWFPINLENKN